MATINSVKLKRNGFATDLQLSFKYGITVKDILSQDLDTGSLILVKTQELDIEPFDEIEIQYETTKLLNFLVGTIQSKIIKFGTTKQYQYDIGLVSLTTQLQRIILPNRTITQSLDGQDDVDIKTIFQRYLNMYGGNLFSSSSMTQQLQDLTENVIAPESQWNRPTLFEVFNDLLKPLGKVVTVKYISGVKKIDFLDLDEEGSAIDETKINNIEIRQDLTEYASDIEIDAQNVYNKNAITHTPEKYAAKTSQQVLITSGNQELILNKPIFDIKKVSCSFTYEDSNNDIQKYTLDITNRVVNKRVWDAFKDTNVPTRVQDTSLTKYKRNYVYFEEGTNIITLNFAEDDWLGVLNLDHKAINNVIYWELDALGETQIRNDVANDFESFLFQELVFNVEYLTTDNILFRVKKDIQPRNKSVLISSQESSLIDSEAFGKQQQEFVNRVGNREMTITGRYDNYNDIPNLKDYIDDFVLVEREIQMHESHYNFKGILSEHYSKDNMFAGINSARKYFSIAPPNEATISNHLTLVDLTISNQDSSNTGWSHEIEKYVVENFGKKDKYIQGAIVSTNELETIYTNNEVLLETTTHAIGKSAIVTLQMNDNYNTHLKIDTTTASSRLLENTPYVDNNGRFREISVKLYRYDANYEDRGFNFKPYYITPNVAQLAGSYFNQTFFDNASAHSARLPQIPTSGTYSEIDSQTSQLTSYTYDVINDDARVFTTGTASDFFVNRYKDNREITHETIQFYFGTSVSGNGSTQEIFVTNEFMKYTPFIYNGSSDYTNNFKIAFSTTLKYNRDSKTYKGTLLPHSTTGLNNSVKLQLTGNEIEIVDTSTGNTGFLWDNFKDNIISYAICDNVGNILIAVNKSGTYEPLYINR